MHWHLHKRAKPNYHDLRPSIGICLLDAIEFRDEEALHHGFQLRTETGLLLTDCLRIHLFELPKYVPPSDNRVVDDPIEQWLYFFCRADESTAEELTARLPDPVFAEATGVLEMIDMTPEQSRGYNLRLKMERDARLQAQAEAYEKGFEEGLEEARAEGMLVGRVKLLQELNGDSPGTTEDLLALGTARLHAMEEELQHRLRDRG